MSVVVRCYAALHKERSAATSVGSGRTTRVVTATEPRACLGLPVDESVHAAHSSFALRNIRELSLGLQSKERMA